jgi:uncharacterized protein YcbK (DUF882 family)
MRRMQLVIGLKKIGSFYSDREGKLGTSLIDSVRTRRRSVVVALLAFAQLAVVSSSFAEERRIEMFNIHTKKDISVVFKRDGKFIPEALTKINHFMRDWRRDAAIKMDAKLIDLIWEIHRELGSKKPVHLISGYRSPKTNALLRKTRGGQAKKSMHMTGQAADIHFPDISVKQLRNSALIRERGGVGYYPTSAIPFVHVDTGRVRHWPRLPRQELAILFPDGRSKHVPTDGKPITRNDFQVALASLHRRGGKLPVAVQNRLDEKRGGRVVLAGFSPSINVPVPEPAPEQRPKMVLASLTPFDGLSKASPARKPETPKPLVATSVEPSSAKSDAQALQRDFSPGPASAPSDTVPLDQIASAPAYDDDHPDELNYQPFRIMPFMGDTPVASMDMTTDSGALGLPKVHMFFGESQQMLLSQFQPGLQYAQLVWAQRFRGTAVNTTLKRLVRDDLPQPVQTARRTRTAQK